MEVEADTREAAVQMIKDKMTAEEIAKHTSEMHPGEPVPSVEEVHAQIEQQVKEVEMEDEQAQA